MAYWLDYSAGVLSAAAIKAAGYEGVIRYVTAPRLMNPPGRNPKHTTKAEFDDHRRDGLKQLLVFQGDTTDADTGFNGGVANARLALEGAQYLGYTGPIFFCNDRTTVPNPAAWKAYLDGAASVLSRGRVGAYGFGNAMDLAINRASFFWQAGRRSEVRKHVHFWQDNNTQVTVGGMTCDRNLPLKSMGDVMEDDMYTFKDLFYDNPVQEFGNFSQLLAEIKDKARAAAGLAASIDKLTQIVVADAANDVTPESLAAALKGFVTSDIAPIVRETVAAALEDAEGADSDEIADKILNKLAAKIAA